MSRLDELKQVFKGVDEGKQKLVLPLIEEAVFLEGHLTELRKYPHIKIHPTNPELQKVTPAGKQYREYLQTYTNIIDKLCKYISNEETEEESPLRAFLESLKKKR